MYKLCVKLFAMSAILLYPFGCRVENGVDNGLENGIESHYETRMNVGPIALELEEAQTLSIADFSGDVEVVGIAEQEAVMFAKVIARAHSGARADELATETFIDLVETDYGAHLVVEPQSVGLAEMVDISITITVPSRTNIETWGPDTLVELENISGKMRFVPEPSRPEPEVDPLYRPEVSDPGRRT